MSGASEVTTVTYKHSSPGAKKEYAEWFGRMFGTIRQFLGMLA